MDALRFVRLLDEAAAGCNQETWTRWGCHPSRSPPARRRNRACTALLAGRRMLELLDNAHDAGLVAPPPTGAPGCLAIVTSRNQRPGLVAAGAELIGLGLLGYDESWSC